MTHEIEKSHEEPKRQATHHSNSWYDTSKLSQSRAILVGVFKHQNEKAATDEHLEELELLSETHNIPVVDKLAIFIREFSARTFISTGKLESLRKHVQSIGANLVIFDDEITPVQQRNLESELKVPVMDRSEVILGVFRARAKSHEAMLQIELAQLRYIAPRLKRMWTHLSRQSGGGGGAGGGGYLKGEGEKQIEIDRRILKQRLEVLQAELKEVRQYRVTQRSRRERNQIPVFAIVGYTNAGKSTLMKHITHADVLVEDKLFATLDTTTRHFVLPNNQEVLIVDTVGFIRKLPHLLVAAFKSTLEEATEADILIHLIDASHPQALEQAKTTFEVLEELHAKEKPIITVINKLDKIENPDTNPIVQKLKMSYPRAILISAKSGMGIDRLFSEMEAMLQPRRKRVQLQIPQSEYQHVATAMRLGTIYSQVYDENDVIIDVELPIADAKRLKPFYHPDMKKEPESDFEFA